MQPEELVRNFGILPAGQPIPRGTVRSEMRRGTVIGQYIFSILLCGFFVLVGVIMLGVAIFAHVSIQTRMICGGIGLFFLAALAFIYFVAMAHDYQWVELEGDMLRARHLYTRRISQRRVQDINDILSEVLMIKTIATRMVEKKQGRIRAFSFRFHDLPKGIKVFRPEMSNVCELVSAVIAKMSEYGVVQPEIIQMEGSPLVRRIYWAKSPSAPAGQPVRS